MYADYYDNDHDESMIRDYLARLVKCSAGIAEFGSEARQDTRFRWRIRFHQSKMKKSESWSRFSLRLHSQNALTNNLRTHMNTHSSVIAPEVCVMFKVGVQHAYTKPPNNACRRTVYTQSTTEARLTYDSLKRNRDGGLFLGALKLSGVSADLCIWGAFIIS